ncbi:MAG: hypothetical protein V7642_5290 [Burkholderiales bacterium]|jgi:hypothetical protein
MARMNIFSPLEQEAFESPPVLKTPRLFPAVKERIAFAEALQTDNNKYLVRAYFSHGNEY